MEGGEEGDEALSSEQEQQRSCRTRKRENAHFMSIRQVLL